MKPRHLLAPAFLSIPFIIYFSQVSALPTNATLYIHIKHASPYPNTLGKVRQIYSQILNANRSGMNVGLEPQCTADWTTQKAYFQECDNIPVMLTVFSSDGAYQLTPSQIDEAIVLCNVKWLRFHEALSYFSPFPTDYAISILELAKQRGIPVFWNEWDVNQYTNLASIISGYEDNVAVSFGTNNNWLEPAQGYELLQRFQRRGASVQSWYWWERNGRQEGYQYTMPPELMRLHTQQAFQAGCEVVQYEPFGYFFDEAVPKTTLANVLV